MAKAMPSGLQQDALGRVSGNGGALQQLASIAYIVSLSDQTPPSWHHSQCSRSLRSVSWVQSTWATLSGNWDECAPPMPEPPRSVNSQNLAAKSDWWNQSAWIEDQGWYPAAAMKDHDVGLKIADHCMLLCYCHKKKLSEAVQWPLQGTIKLQELLLPHIERQQPEWNWMKLVQKYSANETCYPLDLEKCPKERKVQQQSVIWEKSLCSFASVDSQLGHRLWSSHSVNCHYLLLEILNTTTAKIAQSCSLNIHPSYHHSTPKCARQTEVRNQIQALQPRQNL